MLARSQARFVDSPPSDRYYPPVTRAVILLYALSGPALWLHLGLEHHHDHHEDGESHHHAIDHNPAPVALPRDALIAIAAFPIAFSVHVEPVTAPAAAPAATHVRPRVSTEHARAPPTA